MKCVAITTPNTLQIQNRPIPHPRPGQLLIRVAAAGVNRADLLQRRGGYPAPPDVPADIPGLEYAGVVESAGDGVTGRSVGDRVMGLVGGGAYAEYVTVHADETILIPDNIGFVEAAAIPEAFMTAHDALFTQAQLAAGETLLVHAAGSGVGTAAIQLAKAAGAHVVGTARGAEKLERARELGLDYPIDATSGTFASAVVDAIGSDAVNVILELVGGEYLRDDLVVAALKCRIALVGLVAGRSVQMDLGTVLRKRVTIRGTVMRARSHDEKVAAVRAFTAHALPLIERGAVKPVIDRIYELDRAVDAHEYMESNSNFGKVLLRM